MLKNEDLSLLIPKEKDAGTTMKQLRPRSILKKSIPCVDLEEDLDSSNQKQSSEEELIRQSLKNSTFEPLTITRQIGSNNGDSRSVISRSSTASTSRDDGSRHSADERAKNLFDGDRIPKKQPTSETSTDRLPLRSPCMPLCSDPGWYIASTKPQQKCYILEDHELKPAELGNVRNHVYVRLNDSDPLSLVHVTLRKKNGKILNFIAESTQGWPGVTAFTIRIHETNRSRGDLVGLCLWQRIST